MPRQAEAARVLPLALVAVAATVVLLGAGSSRTRLPLLGSAATAWRGLAGGIRPQVAVGQREIVVLKAASLADRVARAGGRATDSQESSWTATAIAAQKQLLATLSAKGIQIRVEYSYTRVLNGFSAALSSEAVSLLEQQPEVAGVYPVRIAYPASVSSTLLAKQGLARGAAHRPEILLPGRDGRGVVIALLDTGVDRAQPFLRGRALDGIDVLGDDYGALPAPRPDDPSELERHGTEMAGLLVGAGGPAGLAGVATGASVLPIRAAGWQRDLTGGWSIYSRTDQLVAGLERAVDPNQDGDAHDAARIALVPYAAPYAAFADSPEARAVQGAFNLDTLVVAPSGNDGPAGPGYGSISSPGAAAAALTVGAADLRPRTEELRVVLRIGLSIVSDSVSPLVGAVVPEHAEELPLMPVTSRAHPGATLGGGFAPAPTLADFFDRKGASLVAGRAALVPAGDDPAGAAENAARAGAAVVALYGTRLPAGALGLNEKVPVPVVAIADDAARAALDALHHHRQPALAIGVPRLARNATVGAIAPFSSHGLAFDGRVKPDLSAPGVALMTSEPGPNEDGSPGYGTVNGSSAASALVAGAAALVAQQRPELDAASLQSLLAGFTRPLAETSVTAQGSGLVDVGAAAAGELGAQPTALAFGRAGAPGWRSLQTLTLTSLSTRRLRLTIAGLEGGGAGLSITARPAALWLEPGARKTVTLTARFLGNPGNAPPAEGTISVGAGGSAPLRVPWTITFGRTPAPLLASLRLSVKSFQPSDVQPTILSFVAGQLVATPRGPDVRPLGRLDVGLKTAAGTSLGQLARLRDLLPGRYTLGLTGRDPHGKTLPPGDYRLQLTALPPDNGPATRRTVTFSIK